MTCILGLNAGADTWQDATTTLAVTCARRLSVSELRRR